MSVSESGKHGNLDDACSLAACDLVLGGLLSLGFRLDSLLHWRVLDLVFQSDFLLDDVDEVDDDDEDADDVLTGLLFLGSTTSSSS